MLPSEKLLQVQAMQVESLLLVCNMPIRKQLRFLVLFLMTTIFLCMLGRSISEWRKKKVGESLHTKSASKIFYPSVTLMPIFDRSFALSKLASYQNAKNLTEIHLKLSHIQSNIISIEQNYTTANG